MTKKTMSITETANLLRVPLNKLNEWIDQGMFPLQRDGDKVSLPTSLIQDVQDHIRRIDESPLGTSATLTRRDFLLGGKDVLTAATGAIFAGPIVAVEQSFYADYQKQETEKTRAFAQAEKAREQMNIIFALRGRMQALDAGNRDLGGPGGYSPDNLAAGLSLTASLGFLNKREQLIAESKDMKQDPDGDLVVVGGPVGNHISRIAFEFEGCEGRKLTRQTTPIVPLRWWGVADETDLGVRSLEPLDVNIEGLGWRKAAHWYLNDLKKRPKLIETRHDSGKNRPFESYLTITRLPNFVGKSFPQTVSTLSDPAFWPSLFVVDGRTGVATRAIELLLQADGFEAVNKAANAIRNCQYGYQLLFRLGGISKVGVDFDRYSTIEYVDVEPINGTVDLWLQAHRYARQNVPTLSQT